MLVCVPTIEIVWPHTCLLLRLQFLRALSHGSQAAAATAAGLCERHHEVIKATIPASSHAGLLRQLEQSIAGPSPDLVQVLACTLKHGVLHLTPADAALHGRLLLLAVQQKHLRLTSLLLAAMGHESARDVEAAAVDASTGFTPCHAALVNRRLVLDVTHKVQYACRLNNPALLLYRVSVLTLHNLAISGPSSLFPYALCLADVEGT